MKKKNIWIILGIIIIIAAFLRLWQLGNVPPSPDWDEAALGYDAYAILHTGRDEFGKFLPVVLRSFDDYKPALYAYLAIPSVAIFGVNVFAVRLPSAISGILMVIVVFYLVQELFTDYRYRDYFSLTAAFIFAISPWSIQFSRVAFESNVGAFLNALTALFFIKGVKHKNNLLILSAIFAALGPYVYQSEKAFTPLLVLALLIIFWKKFIVLPRKTIVVSIVVGAIVIFPMLFYILTDKGALLRVKGTSIFSYQTELLSTDIQKLERDKANKDILGEVLDNRRFIYLKTIASGYLSHFDFNWLFIRGDISRHHAPNMGLLYLFEFPLVLIGIYMLLFGDFDKRSKLIIFAWFLIAPIPASITTGVPHAVRTLNFLPIFQILSALGALSAAIFISNIKYKIANIHIKYLIFAMYILFFIFNFSYYLDQYFVQLNYYDSADWQYGYKQAVDEVVKLQDKYPRIVISDSNPMDKSYMFFLFYLKFPPDQYQKLGVNSSGSFVAHHSFGKYTFRAIDWSRDSMDKNVLFVGPAKEIPDGVGTLKTIYDPDGTTAIKIVGK